MIMPRLQTDSLSIRTLSVLLNKFHCHSFFSAPHACCIMYYIQIDQC